MGSITKNYYRNAIPTGKHFMLYEFECHCCGWVMIDQRLAQLADKMRARLGPTRPNSGARCPKHNAEVGGKPTSGHLRGVAMDWPVKEGQDAEEVGRIAEECGAVRIGINQQKRFVHVEVEDAYLNGQKMPRKFYY